MVCDAKMDEKKDDKQEQVKDREPGDTPTGRKRRRRFARSARGRVTPRRLFQEEPEEENERQDERPGQEDEQARDQDTEQWCHEDASDQQQSDEESADEDKDVFGGDFARETPKPASATSKAKPGPPSSAGSKRSSLGSHADVDGATAKIMEELAALRKNVDKKSPNACLPTSTRSWPQYICHMASCRRTC